MRGPIWTERNIHFVFEVSLWLKGLDALVEIVGGIVAYFIPKQLLVGFVLWIFKDEFAEDPHDVVASFLLHTVQHFSVGVQTFLAIYLVAHGVIKLWLIVGLLRKKLWYYPVAMIVFGLFIGYQLYRYSFTHSIWLVLISALDVIVIVLTWHEYRYLRRLAARVQGAS